MVKKKRLISFILILIGLLIMIGVGAYFLWEKIPLISPVNSDGKFSFLQPTKNGHQPKVVYGFLPYWNVDSAFIQPELTHLGLFSLVIRADGSLAATKAAGYLEPGYSALKSKSFQAMSNRLISQNQKQEIVLAQFDPDIISQFLYSDTAQEKLMETLDSLLLAYPFTGVNIDIEYAGTLTDSLPRKLTEFVTKLNIYLGEKYPEVTLSIDTFASAGESASIWDIESLAPQVDYIVIMTYDYHRTSSVVSGPVAPLFGDIDDFDISNHVDDFLDKVPAEKILLGVPFYGYGWQTTSRDATGHTYPDTGHTATYLKVQELLAKKDELKVEEHWNDEALSPYVTYEEDGQIFTIYYENSRSLSYKLDLVNQLELGGVAIWALGYEGTSRDLWDVIANKIR